LKLPAEIAHTMPAPNVPTYNVTALIVAAQPMTAAVGTAPNVTVTQIPDIASLMIKFMQDQALATDRRAEETTTRRPLGS